MPFLPNLNLAIIDPKKVSHYLLNRRHPDGAAKAAFFMRFGFTPDNREELAGALLTHARTHEVTSLKQSPYGINYVIEGALVAPDGRKLLLRTVWVIRSGETIPRFVTAIPLKGVSR
jgi:hypothetical protein